MQENEEHGISVETIAPADQTSMWDTIRYGGTSQQISPFARDPWEEAHRRILARHKLWLDAKNTAISDDKVEKENLEGSSIPWL